MGRIRDLINLNNHKMTGNFKRERMLELVDYTDANTLCNFIRKTSENFIIADNTSVLNHKSGVVVWTQSKRESESNSLSSGTSNALFPDIFDSNKSITPTGQRTLENLGISVELRKNNTATTTTFKGKIFNYNNTLVINNEVVICLHSNVMSLNKNREKKRRVDLNNITWYEILRYLRKNVRIETQDKEILDSLGSEKRFPNI